MTSRRRASIEISYDRLTEAMHLPKGHRIARIREPDVFMEGPYFEALVVGPDLAEVSDSEITPRITYTVSTVSAEPTDGEIGELLAKLATADLDETPSKPDVIRAAFLNFLEVRGLRPVRLFSSFEQRQ